MYIFFLKGCIKHTLSTVEEDGSDPRTRRCAFVSVSFFSHEPRFGTRTQKNLSKVV